MTAGKFCYEQMNKRRKVAFHKHSDITGYKLRHEEVRKRESDRDRAYRANQKTLEAPPNADTEAKFRHACGVARGLAKAKGVTLPTVTFLAKPFADEEP